MSSLDVPHTTIFDGSPYFELQTTAYGGRSLFAITDLEPCTRIHSCEAPFAYVIYKDYRKEVCAHCFAYSASDHAPSTVGPSRTWNIKWSQEGAASAWFCSTTCRESWTRDDASCLLMEVDSLLTKGQVATRKRSRSMEEEIKAKVILPTFESGEKTITKVAIDAAWEYTEALIASKAHLSVYYSTLHLEDMELEIARVLAAAIVRRYCDDKRPSQSDQTYVKDPRRQSTPWSQLLNLQTNEFCNIQTRPYMLTAYLRVYIFLSKTLPKYLWKYASTVREVLTRDTGNSFGIWDGDQRDEMMGWGIWISASYFNHSCTPNVRKKREGKILHFEVTRRVRAGEELCISYIDTDPPVDQRRRELEESWFFTCRCFRCEEESGRGCSIAKELGSGQAGLLLI